MRTAPPLPIPARLRRCLRNRGRSPITSLSKDYALISLLAALAGLSGCAVQSIRESRPLFVVSAHLFSGQGTPGSPPRAEISRIYRKDEPNNIFTPSPGAEDFWLKPGDYVVKVERCYQQNNDETYIEHGTRLGPDHLFELSVEGGQRYYLGCSSSPDGAIYVSSVPIRFDTLD